MNRQTKYMLLLSEAMISFTFALTTPFVQLHFVKLVSQNIYTLSTLLQTTFCAILQTILRTKENRAVFRKYFVLVMTIDVILMVVINYYGINNTNLRFLGFTIINSVTATIWITIMTEAINNNLSSENLTNFQVLRQSCASWSIAAGGALAVLISYLNIEWIVIAIVLQCVVNLIYAICDYTVYKRLTTENKE